jgi:pimeloyl-ACP methyl ester carboxylesterase
MTSAPTGFVSLADDRRLAYDDLGDPRGRPVVYLHGCPDSRLTRHPDDDIAARAGVRVIAVDRPGYGASDAPCDWTLESVGRDIAVLVERLDLGRTAVLGWSSGGPVALACAAARPDLFATVGVAVGTVPSPADGNVDEVAAEMVPLVVPPDLTAELANEYLREAKSAAYLAALDAVPGLARQLVAGLLAATENGLAGVEYDIRNLITPWRFDPEMITTPVLLWYAGHDDVVPASAGVALAAQLSNASIEVVDDATHLLPLTHWSLLLESIARQLDMEERSCR